MYGAVYHSLNNQPTRSGSGEEKESGELVKQEVFPT
jgi:hypothetical protein